MIIIMFWFQFFYDGYKYIIMKCLNIPDIFVLICNETTAKNILKFKLLSMQHKKIIENENFVNVPVIIKNEFNLYHIITNYKFKNLDLRMIIYNWSKYIDILQHYHTLNLEYTNMPDFCIEQLKGCHTLNISRKLITDNCIKNLKHCHTLIMNFTSLTDRGVKYLGNCHRLELFDTHITDKVLKKLKGCHTVDVGYSMITNKGLKYLGNCHTVKIAFTKTDFKGMRYLKKCCMVELVSNKINDAYILRTYKFTI